MDGLDENQKTHKMGPNKFKWEKYAAIFALAPVQASEKFTEHLVKAKDEKLTLLNTILKYLNTNEEPEKRDACVLIIIKGILKLTIHPYQITTDGLIELMNCLLTEARHFSTLVLTQTVSSCLEFMENNPEVDLPTRWIEIFGKMVAVLTTRDEINFNDDIIDGNEFKSQVITSICRVPWGANNSASVLSAFREIPGIDLPGITLILDKAASAMNVLEPMSVPPIAYQLLLLAGEKRPSSLIYYFDRYFGSISFGNSSESEVSCTDGVANLAKRKALGSTVYFFIQSSQQSETIMKEFVKRVKASLYDHKLVMTPFTLSVSLGLTSIDHIRQVIVDSLRSTIMKSFMDINLSGDTAWYSRVRGNVSDTVTDCFTSVMDAKSSELDFMFDGMKELAMGLLEVEQLQEKDPAAAEKCKALGIYLITSIVQRNREYLPGIINELLKHQKLPFIECLASCLKSVVRTIIQPSHVNRIFELIQHLPRMTVETASVLIKSLLPALQLSHALLGEMLNVLRKTIWKSAEARRISLTALVLMLANSRIIGSIPMSQHSDNSEVFFSQCSQTQVDVFTNRSNEPLCFEIISILKRFFSQQLEVKEYLYLELHNVVRKNPELIGIVSSQLHTHVKTYTNDKGELSIGKVLDSNIREPKLKESLGLLIQCICSVVLRGQRVFQTNDEVRPSSLASCEEFLHLLRTQLLTHGPEYYETEATKQSNESNQLPLDFFEVRNARNTIITEALGALEAFIEFNLLGGVVGEQRRSSVIKLFRKYQELKVAIEKVLPKKKTLGKKKKETQAQSTLQSQDSLRSQQDNDGTQNNEISPINLTKNPQEKKTKVKLDHNSVKKRLTYQHIMNLDSIQVILREFYKPIESKNPLSILRGNIDFEIFLLGVVTQKLGKLKHKEVMKERKRKVKEFIGTLTEISASLWKVCQTTYNPICVSEESNDSDEPTLISEGSNIPLRLNRLALISLLVEFLCGKYPTQHKEVLKTFNNSVYDKHSYEEMFSVFFEVWKEVFKNCVDTIGEDKSLTMELHYLFIILDAYSKPLKPESMASVEVKQWCELFLMTNTRKLEPNSLLVESFLKPYITSGTKSCRIPKHFIQLARQAHYVLGDIDNETQRFEPENRVSWLVTEATSVSIISNFGQYVVNAFKLINEVLGRLKAHSSFIDLERLSNWRDESCIMMDFILRLSTELIRSEFTSAPCGDILLKAMNNFFTTMTSLTLDLIEVHNKNKVDFSSKRYEHLVRLIGKDFKVRVEAFITHVELIGKRIYKPNSKGSIQASIKHKFQKDVRTISELVYYMERYEQQVIALSQKTKSNFLIGAKLSTARDFRIQITGPRENDSHVPLLQNTIANSRQVSSKSRLGTVRSGSRSTGRSVTNEMAPPHASPQVVRRSRGVHSGNRSRVSNISRRERPGSSRAQEISPDITDYNHKKIKIAAPKRRSFSILESQRAIASHNKISKLPGLSLSRRSQSKTPVASPSLLLGVPIQEVLPSAEIIEVTEDDDIEKGPIISPSSSEREDVENNIPPPHTFRKRAGPSTSVPALPEKRPKKLGTVPLIASTPIENVALNREKESARRLTRSKGTANRSISITLPSPIVNSNSESQSSSSPLAGPESIYPRSPAFIAHVPCSVPEQNPDYVSPGTRTFVPNTPTGLTGNTAKPAPGMRHIGLKRKRTN